MILSYVQIFENQEDCFFYLILWASWQCSHFMPAGCKNIQLETVLIREIQLKPLRKLSKVTTSSGFNDYVIDTINDLAGLNSLMVAS